MKQRIVKKADVRCNEILDAAQALFNQKGYNETSVESIIQSLNLSKGAFYHHFKSKAAVLDALVERMMNQLVEVYQLIINDKNLAPLEKLKQFFRGQAKTHLVDPGLMEAVHVPENRELQEKLNIGAINKIAPMLAEIIEQGNESGDFKSPAPLQTAQIFLGASLFVLDSGLFPWSVNERQGLLEVAQRLFEHAIGVPAGSLPFIGQP